MRIAVLTSLYPTPYRPFEGIFAERRWTGMAARGHEVSIVVPTPRSPSVLGLGPEHWKAHALAPREESRSGLSIARPRYWHLPKRANANAERFVQSGLPAVRAAKPDVVVCDYAWPAGHAAHALAQESIPCAISGRGSDVLQVAGVPALRPGLVSALQKAGHWFAVSADLVAAMDELAGLEGRGHLVPNGVDMQRFVPQDREEARRELGLETEGPLVLVIGHLIERKDPLLAARVFGSGAPKNARLAFLGRGPLEQALREELQRLGLEQRADLLGERPPEQLSRWYAACDLLLLCSTREGRPNVVLEALASGRNVLATQAGGTAELLEGLSGACQSSRDPQVLGRALTDLLANPPSTSKLRDQVADLSWERSFERLEDCLREAVSAQTPVEP